MELMNQGTWRTLPMIKSQKRAAVTTGINNFSMAVFRLLLPNTYSNTFI